MSIKYWVQTGLKTLGICWFFGITLIAIAGGSIYPPINQVSKPFVCPTGDLAFKMMEYRPSPGTTVTTTTWVCTNPRGEPQVIGVFPMTIPSGIIYGTLVAIVVMIFLMVRAAPAAEVARREKEANDRMMAEELKLPSDDGDMEQSQHLISEELSQIRRQGEQIAEVGGKFKQAAEEMRELKQMHETGLITQQEFDEKRAEILKKF